MAIEFRCPNCEKKLKTGEDKAGKTAKCPQCGTPVTVPAATSLAEDEFEGFPSFGELEVPPAAAPPRRRAAESGQVACPMCGAMNDPGATRCFACGEDLFGAAPGTARAPSRRFGDIWSRAWEKWTANLGISVGAMLIALVVILVGYVVCLFVPMLIGLGVMGAAGGNNAGASVLIFVVLLGLGYLSLLMLMMYLQLGLSSFSLRLARNREGNLGDMFPPIGKLPATVLALLVVYLAIGIASAPGFAAQIGGQVMLGQEEPVGLLLVLLGYVLQTAGAVIAGAFFWPVPYMIADRATGLIAAIGDGPKFAIANLKLSLLLMVVNAGLVLLGSFACGIGLLFTYSLSFLLFAIAYDRCEKAARVGEAAPGNVNA